MTGILPYCGEDCAPLSATFTCEVDLSPGDEMRHSISRDGLIAGVLGATAVALLFFIGDMLAKAPLATPYALGRGLFEFFRVASTNKLLVVAVYTVFHYAAFIAVGTAAAGIIRWGESTPSVLAGAFVLFVMIEIGFYGLTRILAQSPSYGGLSATEVAIGNLIAAATMGTYLWRAHPELRVGLDHALSGNE